MLKFAYLGTWHSHAGMHVREATQRPDEFQLVGMYDPDPGVIARRKKEWSDPFPDLHVFPSVEAVLDSDAEAVIVEGHVYQNLDYAEAALEAGKHVLLEKPAGVNLAQLERIHKLSEQKGLCLQMAYMWRYNPAIHEMLRLAKLGAFGDIFYYRGHIPKPKSWHPQLAQEFTVYHGGIYFEMAGHLIDLMCILMGEPKAVQPNLGQHFDKRNEVDNAVVVHQFENGLGTIDTAGMHIESGKTRRIEVYGTAGTAIHTPIGSNNLSLSLESPIEGYETGWQDLTVATSSESPSLLREIAACIRGIKEPDYTLAHDLAVQRTLLAGCGASDGDAMKSA
jgi:predicted dehydrogenase